MKKINLASALAIAGGAALAGAFGASFVNAQASYIGTPQDFMEIQQLFARYNYALDHKDGAMWADNFAPDGIFQDPSHCATTRAQIMAIAGPRFVKDADQKSFHFPWLGPITYQDRNHATAHSVVIVVSATGQGITGGGIGTTGTYDDKLVRVNGQWKFQHRLVHRPNLTAPVPCPAGQ